jgi:hypothetical protein
LAFFALVFGGLSLQAAFLRNQVKQKLGFDYETREPLGFADSFGVGRGSGTRNIGRSDSGIMACRSGSTVSATTYAAPGKLV